MRNIVVVAAGRKKTQRNDDCYHYDYYHHHRAVMITQQFSYGKLGLRQSYNFFPFARKHKTQQQSLP